MTSYLIETRPRNPVNDQIVPMNFASGIADEAALLQPLPYALRLRESFTHEISVFADNIPGNSQASIGTVTLNNTDGKYDYLLDYVWGGKDIVIKSAPEGSTYAQYQTIFTGSAIDISATRADLTISLRDNSWKLVKPLQKNKYLGTGDKEGGRDIQGQPKPLCFGLNKNISPVLVDKTLVIYQYHDGAVEDVPIAYDDAVILLRGADYATYELLAAATIGRGAYATCMAEGFIRLGAPPAGNLTLDVHGEFYSEVNLSETVLQILLDRSDLVLADIDDDTFYDFAIEHPYRVSGIYYQTPEEDLDTTVETLLGTGNAFWFFGADGLMRVRRFRFNLPSHVVREDDIMGIQRSFSAKPVHSVIVSYDRNLTVQNTEDFALAANTLNSYAEQECIWVQTAADGSGGDWSNVTTQIHAFLGSTEVNDLRIVDFQEVTPVSWATVNPDGLVTITDPGSSAIELDLRVSLNNYYTLNKLRIRKILGPSAPWVRIVADERLFELTATETALDPAQVITLTLEGANFTPTTWTATDNLGRSVNLTGSGMSRQIAISDLQLGPTLSSVEIRVDTAEGVFAVKKILIARQGQTMADLAILWGKVVDDGNKPEDNATVGAPDGTNVGDKPAEDVASTIKPGGGVADNNVSTPAIQDGAVTESGYTILNLNGASVGTDDDNIWRDFAYLGVTLQTTITTQAEAPDATVRLDVTLVGTRTGGDNDAISVRVMRSDGIPVQPNIYDGLGFDKAGDQVYTIPFFDADPQTGTYTYKVQTRNVSGHPSWQLGVIIPTRLSK